MKILAQAIKTTGRAQVSICRNKAIKAERVSRLVAMAFLGEPPPSKPMACHRDGNPLNNTPGNIYWGDAKTNGRDAIRHGTVANGERNGNSSLDERTVIAIRADKRSSTIIAAEIGVTVSTVCRIRNGQSWAHIK